MCVHSREQACMAVHTAVKLEITHTSTTTAMDGQIAVHSHRGVLCSSERVRHTPQYKGL